MRKTSLSIILFCIFIVFAAAMVSGCIKTEGTLGIKGRVSDATLKTGVPYRTIIVQGLTDLNNLEPIEAGQFLCDSSGSFAFSLRRIKGVSNYNFCFVGDSEYFFMIRRMPITYLKKNADCLSFSLGRLVDLTIKLTRKSNLPVCDTLRLCWFSDEVYGGLLAHYKLNNYGSTKNSFGSASDLDLMWIGRNVNSTITTKVFADRRTRLFWELFRYGKRFDLTDTITCRRGLENIIYFAY